LVLGVVGMVVCLAGIAGMWTASAKLQRLNTAVFAKMDDWVGRIDVRVTQAQSATENTCGLTEQLADTLRTKVAERVEARVEALPQVEELQGKLSDTMGEAAGLLELSASAAELIEGFVSGWEDVAAMRPEVQTRSAQLLETIEGTRRAIDAAAATLAELESRLDDLRQQKDVEENSRIIAQLAASILVRLDGVQQQLESFRDRLTEIRGDLDAFRGRIHRQILLGRILVVLVLVWFGLGQFFLAAHGWRLCRGR
jgi:chromosome segregation ATPase